MPHTNNHKPCNHKKLYTKDCGMPICYYCPKCKKPLLCKTCHKVLEERLKIARKFMDSLSEFPTKKMIVKIPKTKAEEIKELADLI